MPQNSKGFITSIFRRDEIDEICSEKQRLWIEILNKYFEDTVEIKKINPKVYKQKTKEASGSFLNHYDFAYACIDLVNQAAKVTPSVIKVAINDINNIANHISGWYRGGTCSSQNTTGSHQRHLPDAI